MIDPNAAWSREKLLGLLLAVGLGVLVVVIGLGLSVMQLLRPAPANAQPSAIPTSLGGQVLAAGDTRDAAANRPWSAPAVPAAGVPGANSIVSTPAFAVIAAPAGGLKTLSNF